ncbi:fungal hydrophobin [Boletus coccyginus]|nr:fungal hydrophobin [Boletus coccyginus]
MFARVFALLPLALLVSATHLEARDQCNTSDQNCCDSTHTVNPFFYSLLSHCGLLEVATEIGGLVGLNCSPLGVAGVSGNSCTQQPVCCTNNDFNGLVNLGCSPINVNA